MKNKSDYPRVPRKYYAAVMFAAKMVRENGYFNKACRVAANYYDVEEEKVRKYLHERSVAGKKKKIIDAGKKMHYFVIEQTTSSCEGSQRTREYIIAKGYTKEAVERRISDADWGYTMANDYGGYYSKDRYSEIVGEYMTKDEAQARIDDMERGGT